MKRISTFILTSLFTICAMAQDFSFHYVGPMPSDWMADYYYVPVDEMATATGFDSSEEFLTWYQELPDVQDGDKEFMALVTDDGDSYAYSNWGNGFWMLDNGYHCGWYVDGTPTWSIVCYGLTEANDYVLFATEVNGYLSYVGGEHMEGTVAVNGKKRATFFFEMDIVADASPELSKLTKVGQDLNYTFEQYPTNKEALKYYSVPLIGDDFRSGILDLGLDFASDDIATHIFIRQYDSEGMMSDYLSYVRSEATLGPIFNETTGDATEALCLGGQGDDQAIVGGFSFADDVLTFGFGQKANVLKIGDHRTLEVYVVNVDENTYAKINLELNIVESPITHETEKAKMRKVGEETMTYTRGIDDGWNYTTAHHVDTEAVAALFGEGVSIGDLSFKILDNNDEYFIDDYTCNTEEVGFWMTMDSHNYGYSWGSKLYYVFSEWLVDYEELTIGHMPEIFEGGEKTSGSVFLTYADMYYEFHSNITIGEEEVTGIVGEQNVTLIADPNEDIFVMDIPNVEEILSALGCSAIEDASLEARLSLDSEEFTSEGYCEDDGGYPFTSEGVWVSPESETFLDETEFFLGVADGQLQASLMNELKSQQSFVADIALVYKSKYYVLHVTICDEETSVEKVTTTQNNANAPLFNLSGQRVNNSYKGIIVKDGKKYLK